MIQKIKKYSSLVIGAILSIVIIYISANLLYKYSLVYWFLKSEVQAPHDSSAESPWYKNNKIRLLMNGVNSNPARMENISEADTILIKTFEFHDDETGNALVDKLIAKAKNGAKIFIQFDVKGTRSTSDEIKNIWLGYENPIPPVLRRLADTGGSEVFILPTNSPIRLLDYLLALNGSYVGNDHEKYLITWNSKDHSAAVKIIMGGLNIADEYMFGGTKEANGHFRREKVYNAYGLRDTDIEVIGPVALEIVNRYIRAAEFQSQNQNRYYQKHIYHHVVEGIHQLKQLGANMVANKMTAFPEKASTAKARFIAKGLNQRDIEHVFIEIISALPSGETFKFATAFFLPTPELQKVMIEAENRGVKFKLLTNGFDATESSFVTLAEAGHCRYRYLNHQAKHKGFEFYEWHGNEQMGVRSLHQKLYSMGQGALSPFIIGSSNTDASSLVRNSEGILVVQDASLKQQVDKMLDNDFHQPQTHRLTEEELEQESYYQKFNECVYDWLFHSIL